MVIKKATYSQFANKVKGKNLQIIVYAAGAMGQVVAPYFFEKYGLEENVLCYVDADDGKSGETVQLVSRAVSIKPVGFLESCPEDGVILVASNAFYSILEVLNKIRALDGTEAFILPLMQMLENSVENKKWVKQSDIQRIPKRIHYCWFSGNPIPPMLEKCIESWYQYCPDYEITRWDESNYDINKHLYTKQAYENKKWGFVPDIVRLEILYECGGIYLDTDVELIRCLDELLYQEAFCGVERSGLVNFGGCSGAASGNEVIKEILEKRLNIPFVKSNGTLNLITCGLYETKPLLAKGLQLTNKVQNIDGLTVFPSEFFHPYDYTSGELHITENTFAIHHFNGGWLDEKSRENKRKTSEFFKKIMSWEV